MIWPWWVQALLGVSGLIWSLETWARLRKSPPGSPGLVLVTAGLTFFSAILLIAGLWRWLAG